MTKVTGIPQWIEDPRVSVSRYLHLMRTIGYGVIPTEEKATIFDTKTRADRMNPEGKKTDRFLLLVSLAVISTYAVLIYMAYGN